MMMMAITIMMQTVLPNYYDADDSNSNDNDSDNSDGGGKGSLWRRTSVT